MTPEVRRSYSGEVMVLGLTESQAAELSYVIREMDERLYNESETGGLDRWLVDLAFELRSTMQVTRAAIDSARHGVPFMIYPEAQEVGRDNPALNEPRAS